MMRVRIEKMDLLNILKRKKLFFSLFLALLIFSPAYAEMENQEEETAKPTAIFQIGQPITVDFILPKNAQSVRLRWQNHSAFLLPVNSTEDGNEYSSLIGTDLKNTKPGPQQIKIYWTEDDIVKTKEYEIELAEKSYPSEKLTVSPTMTQLSKEALERVRKETELTKKALTTVTPGKAPKLPLVRPVPGIYTSPYGKSRYFNGELKGRHNGLDMRAAIGTPIKAAADGTVVLTGDYWFAGKFVMLSHGAGLISFYCHMSKIEVKENQEVKAGTVLGLSGQTGRVTGPHLHFSLAWNGEYFDPAPLLENKIEKIVLD
ncbi:MAG: M23 family metallopeptidase [Synergistaceae bacterium]